MSGPDRIGREAIRSAHGLSVLEALAAFSAREIYRIHMNDLGNADAVPVPKDDTTCEQA
jgi:hypothetical protein